MKQVARLGDRHVCPVHGVNAITATASVSTADGCAIATVGDMTGCGAVIVTGADSLRIDGRPVAQIGSKTSHGGTISQGSSSVAAR